MDLTSLAPRSGFARNFAAVRWAQGMVATFVRPARAVHPSRQELSAMPDSGSEVGTIATAAGMSAIEDAAAVQSPDGASPGMQTLGEIAVWRAVDVDVSALIGHRGTAAVLRRALAMTRRTHGWLPELSDDASFEACLHALGDVLEARGAEESGAGSQALQATFRDLLVSLIGASLTTQLLSAAWTVRQARAEPVP